MKNQIRTEVDLLNVAAEALNNKNSDTLYDLIEVVEGWMVGEDEANAYKAIISSMVEAIGQMAE